MTPANHYRMAEHYLFKVRSADVEPQEEDLLLCVAALHVQLAQVGATMLSGSSGIVYHEAHVAFMDAILEPSE